MRSISIIAIGLLLTCASPSLHAQVVNIESARIQSDTTGWAGSGGAGISMEKNRSKIVTVDLEAHVQYKTKKDLWLLLADYGFLKGGGEKFVSNSFAHLRYNRKLNSYLRWEVFAQAQSNYITQIKWRFLFGTGPRFKIFSIKQFRLYAASLIMYEHETENADPEVVHNDLRSSSYVSFTFLPNEQIELISTLFYQPAFSDWHDSRLFNQSVMRVKASKRFSMYIKWNYLFDSRPAGTAPETTYRFISGFNFSF